MMLYDSWANRRTRWLLHDRDCAVRFSYIDEFEDDETPAPVARSRHHVGLSLSRIYAAAPVQAAHEIVECGVCRFGD